MTTRSLPVLLRTQIVELARRLSMIIAVRKKKSALVNWAFCSGNIEWTREGSLN